MIKSILDILYEPEDIFITIIIFNRTLRKNKSIKKPRLQPAE